MRKTLLALTLSFAAVLSADAAPNLFTYQGRLKEGGTAVTGNRTVEIFLCNAVTGGACTTTQAQSVAVTNGLFRSTFTIPGSVDLGAGSWWLEIKIGANTLAPREQLASNAYSLFSATAAYAQNLVAAPGSAGVTVSTSLFVSGSSFTVNASAFVVTGGAVGIGTPTPGYNLHVLNSGPVIGGLESQGAWNAQFVLKNSVTEWDLILDSGDNNKLKIAKSGSPKIIMDTNVVGLGIVNPNAALDVVSTGTASNIFAQIWRNGAGVAVASVTSQGVLFATLPPGAGDNLGNHTATQNLNLANFALVNASALDVTGNSLSVGVSTFVVSSGRVGINTAPSPGSSLSIAPADGGSDGQMVFYDSVGKYMQLRMRGTGAFDMVSGAGTYVSISPLGAPIAYFKAGLVGINTLWPSSMLHVESGSVTISGPLAAFPYVLAAGDNGIVISTGGAITTTGIGHGAQAGLARGMGAVDLQTYRAAGSQVASGLFSTLSGGQQNTASAQWVTVAGGYTNSASAQGGVVSGGHTNTASGSLSTVAGGYNNMASGAQATVSGGQSNTAGANNAAVAGGTGNSASSVGAFVGGGQTNGASGQYSAVAGGSGNTAVGNYAAVPGGSGNSAGGTNSFAAGQAANSGASNAFTWNDSAATLNNTVANRTVFKNMGGFVVTGSTNMAMAGTVDRGLVVSGDGLVGIATAAPQAALDIVSTGTAANIYAQLWRNSSGVIVATMSATGVFGAGSLAGPLYSPIISKTGTYAAAAGDEVIAADASGGAFTVTLPTAVGVAGKRYTVKKTDASVAVVTVNTTGGQTIDGIATYSLAIQNKHVTVISNGANWLVIANN